MSQMAHAAVSEPEPTTAVTVPSAPTQSLADKAPSSEAWAIHGQFTNVTQGHPRFRSPYSGDNSLDANGRNEETTDLTLFAGLRLGRNTEFWANPEIDQGFGMNNTLGVAGFPSGEAYKVGSNAPYLRLPRAFIRHVIPLGGTEEKIEPGANQLAGSRASDNLTLTVGKFSAVDIFDANSYAHDPRADFLNWSVIDAGAFDYAADSWGLTYGAAAEWTQGWWTLRGGVFQMSDVPNAKVAGIHFHQHMLVTELETRHEWQGHPGKVKLLAFVNRADMANYRDALQVANQTAGVPDVSLVRRYQSRPGLVINLEQELSSDLGVFARASANDGSKEAYEFTEINKSLSAGLSLKGDRWGRHDDTVGVAAVVNGLSDAAREYFAAGGMGILIGDGRLNYGPEKIVETYYSLQVNPHLSLALNYQHVVNPAYNRDRGPVSIVGIRLHSEF
ncbi:carbohydrate porin [Noviherbaspirillum sp. DKR-6]|uniref:Carbohydrate porin n=2 Tax=Noviherbaspirillum pedocola TaxID=2801341 RepID=A0A934SZG9_9BURK|nr:carbohydrate porin [Noviherbaspirillum pedocola]